MVPDNLDAILLAADLAGATGNLEEARRLFLSVVRRHEETRRPGDKETGRQGDKNFRFSIDDFRLSELADKSKIENRKSTIENPCPPVSLSDLARVYLSLAELEIGSGRLPEAVSCLRLGLKVLPERIDLLQVLAYVLIQQNEIDEAQEIINRLRRGTQTRFLQETGFVTDYLHARLLFQKQQWTEATRLLEGIRPVVTSAEWANDVDLLLALGYEHLGDSDRQLAAYRRVVDREPLSSRGRFGLGSTLFTLGRFDEALREYQRMDDLQPGIAIRLARLLCERKRYAEAAQVARQAVGVSSKDYRDHVWLGQTFEAAGLQAEAEASLRRAVQLASGVADPWIALLQHLVKTKQTAKLETVIEEVRRSVSPEQTSLALARCYETIGRTKQADVYYRLAVTERPRNPTVLRQAARFFLDTHNMSQAEPYLRRLIEPDTDAPTEFRDWARRQLAVSDASQKR